MKNSRQYCCRFWRANQALTTNIGLTDAARMMVRCRGRLISWNFAGPRCERIYFRYIRQKRLFCHWFQRLLGLSVFGLRILVKVGAASKTSSNRPRIFFSVPPPHFIVNHTNTQQRIESSGVCNFGETLESERSACMCHISCALTFALLLSPYT